MKTIEGLVVIAIGKNEGERLLASLASIPQTVNTVFVDSGSRDRSVELVANSFPHIRILKLEASPSLCAAVARNAGAREAQKLWPRLQFLQFIDADCKLAQDWLESGLDFMSQNPAVTAVCGFRKEEKPQASIFNRLCDLEWEKTLGLISSCGGDFLIRAREFFSVEGFNEVFTAGEEADFFARIYIHGGGLHRISKDMTYHDAKILKLSTWLRRALRGGVALVLGARFYPGPLGMKTKILVIKTLFWAFLLPLTIVLGPAALGGVAVLYSLNFLSSLRHEYFERQQKFSDALLYSCFTVLAKWPQALGIFIGSLSRTHKNYSSYR